MTGIQKKTLIVVIIIVGLIALVASCKHPENEHRQMVHEQELQEYGQEFTRQYLEGVQIMSELDYDHPDKEKVDKAVGAFVSWLPMIRQNDAYDDIFSEAIKNTKPPYTDDETNVLYSAACALKELEYYDDDIHRALSGESMLRYYVEEIPNNYQGVCKEKIVPFRQKVLDYYESVIRPIKEKPVARTPAPVREHTGPGHYDENGYWETEDYDYIDEYDHDGYMDEVFEDNANDYKAEKKSASDIRRHTGGGIRRWRD